MAEKLALFPLGLVPFPGEKLNLHIFEPRYRQLIQDCDEEGIRFGIPTYTGNIGMTHGTEMKLLKIETKYPDGKMDISSLGLRVFRLKDYQKTMIPNLYPGGEVEFLEDDMTTDIVLIQKTKELLSELFELMNINYNFPENIMYLSSYKIGHKAGMSVDQEYEMLKIRSESERLLFIIQHLEQLLPTIRKMEVIRKKIQMNGHFRNVMPPDV